MDPKLLKNYRAPQRKPVFTAPVPTPKARETFSFAFAIALATAFIVGALFLYLLYPR